MSTVLRLGTACFAVAIAAACNSGNFTGSAGKKADESEKTSTATASNTSTKPENSTDAKAKTPAKTDKPLGTPSLSTNTSTSTSSVASNFDQANAKPDSTLSDLLNALPAVSNDIITSQPDPNTVVFGGSKRFHIGDGAFTQSSCGLDLGNLTTAGAQYYFQFNVTQDGTDVTVTLGEVCGVDYKFSNTLSVVNSAGATVAQQLLVPNTNDQSQVVTLQAPALPVGQYQVVITSNNCDPSKEGNDAQGNPACTQPGLGQTATDRDDFIVGKVNVNGTKPIHPGKAGAQAASP